MPNAPMTGWSVVDQQETFDRDPSGQVVAGVRVYFQLTDGPSGSVFISRSRYNEVNARAAVAAAAAQMAAVHQLSG